MRRQSLFVAIFMLLIVLTFWGAGEAGVSAAMAGPAALTPTAEPPTFTPTATDSPLNTPTATRDFHPTDTPEPTHTTLPTGTPFHPTDTPEATHTPVSEATPTGTIVPTATSTATTATPVATVETHTPTPTNTPGGTIPPAPATASPVPTATPGGTIPPPPDASLMSVTAFCDAESLPSWTIRNNSPFNMREPRNFFLLAGDGDDDSCALDTVGRDPDGSFFLLAGQEITGRFRNIDFSQPQRICVQQSPGPLRKAFASAVIGRNGNGCATALNPDGEPWGVPRVFLPWSGR